MGCVACMGANCQRRRNSSFSLCLTYPTPPQARKFEMYDGGFSYGVTKVRRYQYRPVGPLGLIPQGINYAARLSVETQIDTSRVTTYAWQLNSQVKNAERP